MTDFVKISELPDAGAMLPGDMAAIVRDGITMHAAMPNPQVGKSFNGTVSGGNIVIYPTDTGLVGGNALFASIDYVHATFDNNDPNLGRSKPVVSGDLKTITIACAKQTFAGITVLGIAVLGSNSLSFAPDGTAVSVFVQGKMV